MNAREAVAGTADGETVLIGGFGPAGEPVQLIEALLDSGAEGLTVEFDLVLRGNLAERIRAGGAAIGAGAGEGAPGRPVREPRPDHGRRDDHRRAGRGVRGDRPRTRCDAGHLRQSDRPHRTCGKPKLLEECTYPLTGLRCVSRVYADLATFLITENGVVVRDLHGIEFTDLQSLLDVPLTKELS
ncbi:hypothetical protein GCM10022267_55980 [Lentzea roselyniae]|uniref:Uncharacterized protein n=1 Tax=Lentzea roselyniae TaxID=531940 RepID=A0ABP7BL78_9PSEU